MSEKEYQLSFHEINPNPSDSINKFRMHPSPIIIVLDGLEDIRNIGSLFRLADAARIAKIYGFRMKQEADISKIERVSRQTSEHIEYTGIKDIEEIKSLTNEYYPIALEYTNKSIPFTNYHDLKPCMLIIGNERRGVSKELLSLSQSSLHVPMLGKNSSMNVSVASGIVVYHLLSVLKVI